MSILKSLKKQLFSIDMLGSKIGFTHNGDSQIKSTIGGLLTIGICIFFIYIVIYIGEDLIYKAKPISRLNKEYNETTGVTLKEYPYSFYFVDPVKNFRYANADKYFTISALWYHLYLGGPGAGVSTYPLSVEKCTSKHVAAYEKDFTQNVDFNYTWCINPTQYKNGTTMMEDDLYFLNEYSSVGSAFIIIRVSDCMNTTANGNSCVSQPEIDSVKNSLSVGTYFMDSYIDLNKYDNPGTMYLNRMVFAAPKTVQKIAYHRVKNIYLDTDSGIIFEDVIRTPMLQVEKITADVVSRDYFFSIILEGSRIKDAYYRRYIKIQDIMAYTGGVFKFILWAGNLLLLYFNESDFQIEIFNKYYSIANIAKSSTFQNESKFNERSVSNLQSMHINNFVTAPPKSPPIKTKKHSDLTLLEFLKSRLCLKTRFKRNNYNSFIELVNENFEIMNIFKGYFVNRYIQRTLLNEEQRKEIMFKENVIVNMDEVNVLPASDKNFNKIEISHL
jgi:hypothetical protein